MSAKRTKKPVVDDQFEKNGLKGIHRKFCEDHVTFEEFCSYLYKECKTNFSYPVWKEKGEVHLKELYRDFWYSSRS